MLTGDGEHPEENAQKKAKKDEEEIGGAAKKADNEAEVSGNLIIMKGDDSLWKTNEKTAASYLAAGSKDNVRENDFEDYLEDLFM